MCIYNTMGKNRKYVKNKTNNGKIPTLPDRRIEYIPYGCGKCIECRKKYARDWQIRLLEDIKTNTKGKFVTLTFSDESIAEIVEMEIVRKKKKIVGKEDIEETDEYEVVKIADLKGYEKDNMIATKAVERFRERWRRKFGKSPRHWLVTELGHKGTENIHLHGIIWTDETYNTIRERWEYGYIWPRPDTQVKTWVNARTVNYMIKYLSKIDQRNKEYKARVLASPGIGANYVNTIMAKQNKFNNRETKETYTTETGHKIALPIYWRNKLYTEAEKEQLWLNKLDKQIRYVLGVKIDISKGEKEYNRAVKSARELNTELGYGQRQNDNRKEYEDQRREIQIITRIQKAKNKKASGGV